MLSLTTLLCSLLLGAMMFFAIIVAPAVHHALESDQASKLTRTLFPRYFLWGIIFSALAVLTALLAQSFSALLLALVLIGFIYSRQLLVGQINRVRDQWHNSGSAQDKSAYKVLHRRSVIINATQMLILLAIVIANQILHPG